VRPKTKAGMVSLWSEHLSEWLSEVLEMRLCCAAVVTEQWVVTTMQACWRDRCDTD